MDAKGIKAALWLLDNGYDVVAIGTSIKGESVIHMDPLPLPSITRLAQDVGMDIEWSILGVGGDPLPGSYYELQGSKGRIVGTVAVAS